MSPFAKLATLLRARDNSRACVSFRSRLCASAPLPPGVAGACALSLFKGRDELSSCIRVRNATRGPDPKSSRDGPKRGCMRLRRRDRAVSDCRYRDGSQSGLRFDEVEKRPVDERNGSTISMGGR